MSKSSFFGIFAAMSNAVPKQVIIGMLKRACERYLKDETEDNLKAVETHATFLITKMSVEQEGGVENFIKDIETKREILNSVEDVKEILDETKPFE